MPEDHGVFDNKVANGTMGIVVHVAAAYACVVDSYQDVVGILDRGLRLLNVGDIKWFVKYER